MRRFRRRLGAATRSQLTAGNATLNLFRHLNCFRLISYSKISTMDPLTPLGNANRRNKNRKKITQYDWHTSSIGFECFLDGILVVRESEIEWKMWNLSFAIADQWDLSKW